MKRKGRIKLVLDGRLCEYGCGGQAHYEFRCSRPEGKACCSMDHTKCIYHRKQISDSLKGLVKSDETKRKLSISKGGTGKYPRLRLCACGCGQVTTHVIGGFSARPRMYVLGHIGRKQPKFCECGCGGLVGVVRGKPGRRFVSGHNTRILNPQLLWNKRMGLFLGEQLCEHGCGQLAHYQFNNGVICCSPTIQGCSVIKRKIGKANRFNAIKRIEEQIVNGGQIHPTYNFYACKFFRQLDKDFKTEGRHAENGKEYYIADLGYWVDYINFSLKLIIEWDEKHHYNANGNLKEKDVQRQREIEARFPDFLFLRIREDSKFSKGFIYRSIRRQK